jgi:predicted AlkP superfamily pyrophosphatase or phosphodiesterase
MSDLKQVLLILAVSILIASCENQQSIKDNQSYLIMLSLDGFRWDYTENANTPTFDSLRNIGVQADAIIPSFPTKTFPNHYSMATGLYPDNHGIVLNGFYAPDLKRDYNKDDKSTVSDDSFYFGEPIWTTAELQGIKSASLFWVGSEAPIKGNSPTYFKKYDESMSFEARIDTIYSWLSLPADIRPHLVLWYYHEPDEVGHYKGPESKEITSQIEELDNYLGDFFRKMKTLPEFDKLNFIVTSDHGMGAIDSNRKIILDHVIDTSDLELYDGWNPVWNLKVKEIKKKEVFNKLKQIEQLQVWYTDSIPNRLHYGNNIRTHDITVAAKAGWSIYWSWAIGKNKGTHGYDNSNKDMYGIFYATGPAFKKSYNIHAFENVNLYPLIADIMNLKPAVTDGKLENVQSMLIKTK